MAKARKWQLLRTRTVWLLLLPLVASFVLFFHATGRMGPGGSGGSAGTLFGQNVPWDVFKTQQDWVFFKLSNRLQGFPPDTLRTLVKEQTWRELLLLHEAKRRRLRVSDRELATFIQQMPALQEKGRFRSDYYHAFLQSKRLTANSFEGLIRNDLLMDKLLDSVKRSVTITDEDVKAAYRETHEQLAAALLVFPPDRYMTDAAAAVTDQAVRAEYEAHPELVTIPAQIRFDYIGASREELASREQPSQDVVKTFYDDHPEAFAAPDGKPTPFEDAKAQVRRRVVESAVRKRLTSLALDLDEDLRAKRAFEAIATTRGVLIRSVGSLPAHGEGPSGNLPQELLKAVRKVKEGQLSDVVETDQGVWVTRLTQRIPEQLPPFETVRATIRDRLMKERARQMARQAAETLRIQLKDRQLFGVGFAEALTALKAQPASSVTLTRADPIAELGEAPLVNRAAFEAPLAGLTDVLETPRGFVLVHPEHRIEPDWTDFDKIKAKFREETLTKKHTAALEQWLKDLEAQAKIEQRKD